MSQAQRIGTSINNNWTMSRKKLVQEMDLREITHIQLTISGQIRVGIRTHSWCQVFSIGLLTDGEARLMRFALRKSRGAN